MATDGDIEETIRVINRRTDNIYNLLNNWNENQNQNDDTNRQNFNTDTNNILTNFEQIVDIINRTHDNTYFGLAIQLSLNLNLLLNRINDIFGNPDEVDDPRHQVRSELGLLDKTQRMTTMKNILDNYIIQYTPPSGGSKKCKHKKVRKTRKSGKSRKTKKTQKGKKSRRTS